MKLLAKLFTVAFCASVFAALVATPVRAQDTGGDKGKMGSMKMGGKMHTMAHGKMMSGKHHRKHRGRKKGHPAGMKGRKMGMMKGKKMGMMNGMKKGM